MMAIILYDKHVQRNELDSFKSAINYFELALSHGNASSLVEKNCYTTLYQIYILRNEPQKAKQCAQNLARKDEKSGNYYLGIAEQIAENYESAVSHYESAYGCGVDSAAIYKLIEQCRDSLSIK